MNEETVTEEETYVALTQYALTRFLDACKRQHDGNPSRWHRKMMEPPRTRTERCQFCNLIWENYRESQR